jgi:hypothetical protein
VVIRGFLWFVRVVVGIVPVLLLAMLGAFYISDLVTELLAPGVPVTLSYSSPAGKMTLHFDSYRIDPA